MTFDQAPPASAAAAGLEARASMIDNPGNCQARQYRMLIIILCVMPPIVALRFVSRHIRRMRFGWDDLTLVLGFVRWIEALSRLAAKPMIVLKSR